MDIPLATSQDPRELYHEHTLPLGMGIRQHILSYYIQIASRPSAH